MRLLLDTHVIVWAVSVPENLSDAARSALVADDSEVYVSPISCAEIACAYERKRLELDRHWRLWFHAALEQNGWQNFPVDLPVIEEAYSLPPPVHGDPADRIILATARVRSCRIVTADSRLLRYPHAATIW